MRRVPADLCATGVGLICLGLVLHLERLVGKESLRLMLPFTIGPVLGAIAQRCRGGRGILGGVIGGVVSYVGIALVLFLRVYLDAGPASVNYLDRGLAFLALTFAGSVVGLFVGILTWSVMQIDWPWGQGT